MAIRLGTEALIPNNRGSESYLEPICSGRLSPLLRGVSVASRLIDAASTLFLAKDPLAQFD